MVVRWLISLDHCKPKLWHWKGANEHRSFSSSNSHNCEKILEWNDFFRSNLHTLPKKLLFEWPSQSKQTKYTDNAMPYVFVCNTLGQKGIRAENGIYRIQYGSAAKEKKKWTAHEAEHCNHFSTNMSTFYRYALPEFAESLCDEQTKCRCCLALSLSLFLSLSPSCLSLAQLQSVHMQVLVNEREHRTSCVSICCMVFYITTNILLLLHIKWIWICAWIFAWKSWNRNSFAA